MTKTLLLVMLTGITTLCFSQDKKQRLFTKDVTVLSSTETMTGTQFYVTDSIKAVINEKQFTSEARDGATVISEKVIIITPNQRGTFAKRDADGTVWITFGLREEGVLPGDSIIFPFYQKDSANIYYVLKKKSTGGSIPGAAQKPGFSFAFNGYTIRVFKGMGATKLVADVVLESSPILGVDRVVGAKAKEEDDDVYESVKLRRE